MVVTPDIPKGFTRKLVEVCFRISSEHFNPQTTPNGRRPCPPSTFEAFIECRLGGNGDDYDELQGSRHAVTTVVEDFSEISAHTIHWHFRSDSYPHLRDGHRLVLECSITSPTSCVYVHEAEVDMALGDLISVDSAKVYVISLC